MAHTSDPSPARMALEASGLFLSCPTVVLDKLAARLRSRRFRRGEVMFHRGDPGTTLYLIAEGRVKVTVPTDEGADVVLTVLRPGDLLGELAVFDGAPRSASAVALEPVTVWTLHRDDLLGCLQDPATAAAMLAALARRLRRADELVEDLSSLALDARLARVLLRLAEDHGEDGHGGTVIDVPLTQSDLAAMTGATRPPVNLLLGAYQDAGIIRFAGRAIVVRDASALRLRAAL